MVLTTICTWRSGSAFSIVITTWPLSLASWVPSTSMTTSGVTFLGGAEVVPELLDVVAAGWAVWSRRHLYISSSSWAGTSSTSACKGAAKSTNKSCHLLNYVTWIAGTSGPSRLDLFCLPACRCTSTVTTRCWPPAIPTPAPEDVEGPLVPAIQAT